MLKLIFLVGVANCLILESDQDILNMVVHLQSKVNTLEEEMVMLKQEGCVVQTTCQLESKPSFMATLESTLDHCALNQPVIFDGTKLNIGSGYDPRHGIFRAPQNGTYYFSATLSVTPQSSFHVAFVKNNVSNVIGYLYADSSSIYHERATSVLIQLIAGDDIWINCLAGDSHIIGGNYHSHFSGFMISP